MQLSCMFKPVSNEIGHTYAYLCIPRVLELNIVYILSIFLDFGFVRVHVRCISLSDLAEFRKIKTFEEKKNPVHLFGLPNNAFFCGSTAFGIWTKSAMKIGSIRKKERKS